MQPLRNIQSFSIHGLLKMLVSDNTTCFTSAEFADFMSKSGKKNM